MFNVTIDMSTRGPDENFSTVHEEQEGAERSRRKHRRDTGEDDQRRAQEDLV